MLRGRTLHPRMRQAFTLIELLVSMAIIAVLATLLLASIQKAREVAARTVCTNNMRMMGISLHNYNDVQKHFPSGGEGTNANYGALSGKTYFDLHSVFTLMLPYVEHEDIYKSMDLRFAYNDPVAPGNLAAAQQAIKTYLCPSNPLRPKSGVDAAGFGYTDYGPTIYTDIDPTTGVRNKGNRVLGGLYATSTPPVATTATNSTATSTYVQGSQWIVSGTPVVMTTLGPDMSDIRDGLTNTIAISEDVGRHETMTSPYPDPVSPNGTATNTRCFWRWAEPDNGFGVSGDPLADANATTGSSNGTANTAFTGVIRAINNNYLPFGGGNCPWITGINPPSGNNNCGPNDEMFGFHGGGVNAVFLDGHVSFLSEDINPLVIRRLVSSSEGLPVQPGVNY